MLLKKGQECSSLWSLQNIIRALEIDLSPNPIFLALICIIGSCIPTRIWFLGKYIYINTAYRGDCHSAWGEDIDYQAKAGLLHTRAEGGTMPEIPENSLDDNYYFNFY